MAKKTTAKRAQTKKAQTKKARTGTARPRKAVAGRKNSGGLGVPPGGVRVRMYRQGFGDCFLLSFGRGGGDGGGGGGVFHMLIDCGLLPGAPSTETMRRVVEDISETTGGKLDVLVCTHEHADHLSGFLHAREAWEKMRVGELWLAWTEDPADEVANRLRAQRERRRSGLRAAEARLRAAAEEAKGGGERAAAMAAANVEEVGAALRFFGARQSPNDTAAALEFVRSLVGRRPRYCEPGGLIATPALPGVRFYVMGPPREERMLKKDKPSSGEGSEVYHAAWALTSDAAFFAAAGKGGGPGEEELTKEERLTRDERSSPFDAGFQISTGDVERATSGPEAGLRARYFDEVARDEDVTSVGGREVSRREWKVDQGWRRVDHDWLGVAGSMALKLDEDTNNTSIVLAIELVGSGRVLLFPGDAQVGSWLSWDDCSWRLVEGGREREVTVADLLGRTVLYKVGHHASHNATLKEKGLERMLSGELVAMIPVVESTARAQGKYGWKMPYPPLLKELEKRTGGRVMRVDNGVPVREGVRARLWGAFNRAAHATALYVDYVIPE